MATLTITTTAQQDARIAPAFGDKLGLPSSASAAQVKADVIEYITNVVRQYEQKQAIATAVASVSTITPS